MQWKIILPTEKVDKEKILPHRKKTKKRSNYNILWPPRINRHEMYGIAVEFMLLIFDLILTASSKLWDCEKSTKSLFTGFLFFLFDSLSGFGGFREFRKRSACRTSLLKSFNSFWLWILMGISSRRILLLWN